MRSRKRNNWKLILVVILLTISLGYAFLQTDLTINGTSKINATSWDIHFEDLTPNPDNVTLSTGDVVPTIDSTTRTDITYTITLKEPGDFYEFEVAVVNGGTLDAMIGTITNKLNGNEISTTNSLPAYLDYSVAYSDTTPIGVNQILEAGNAETIKVRLAFRPDIDPSDLPTEGATNTLSFGLSYVQVDSNAIEVPHPFTGTKYTINRGWDSQYVYIGQAIPDTIVQYSTAAEALATLHDYQREIPIYLKHTIVNGIVTESYTEFVITEDFATQYPSTTVGTYALQASNTCEYNSSNQTYNCSSYDRNVEVLNSAFGVSNCHDISYMPGYKYVCDNTSLYVTIDKNGGLYAMTNSFGCGNSAAYSGTQYTSALSSSCGQTLD